jgi:hypothetical protein
VPFTLAHPAAVLPLLRRPTSPPLVPSALVAGSLAPDVPYFLQNLDVRLSAQDWYHPFFNATESHSWPGLLRVTLPLAVALLGIWLVVRSPVLEAVGIDPPAGWGPVLTLLCAVPSALLGVMTHVAWDRLVDAPGDTATTALYAVSSGLGLCAVVWWLVRHHRPHWPWPLLVSLVAVGAAGAVLAWIASAGEGYGQGVVLRDMVTWSMTASIVALVVWSMARRLRAVLAGQNS